MGLPIIGCNRRGVRELIQHEVTGLFVERNVDAVAKAMERIARDSDLHTKLKEGSFGFRECLERRQFNNVGGEVLKGVDE